VFNVKAGERIAPIDLTKFSPPSRVVVTYYVRKDAHIEMKGFLKEIKNSLRV
jgi:hypothetical protein